MDQEEPVHFQKKWKFWFKRTIRDKRKRLDAIQKRYNKNYDARLRCKTKMHHPEDYVYLRHERKDHNKTSHKLAAVTDGP